MGNGPAFQTLAEFQQMHERLLAAVDDDGSNDGAGPGPVVDGDVATAFGPDDEKLRLTAALDDIRDFMRRGAGGGAYLDEPKERRAAQSLLDYWASQCYGQQLDIARPLLAAHDPALLPTLADDACTYVGLDAFGEGDARHFFGRDDQVTALLARLQNDRLVVVTGASGSGKSSLVLAGLIPALKRGRIEGSAGWRYLPTLVPGATPLRHLALAIAGTTGNGAAADAAWIDAQVAAMLADGGHAARLLAGDGVPAVVVVDQFEEALTLRTEQTSLDYTAFVDNLRGLVETASPPHRLVLTMRKDVEPQLAREYPELNQRYGAAAFPVYSMESARLREAIERPAAQAGLKFQSGVVDELIKSVVGEDASLPLLQFTLMALWARRKGNLITHEAYREVGNPRQALAEAAGRVYAGLPAEQQLAAQQVFVALSRQGDGATVFRNRATRRALQAVADPGNVDKVLDKFAAARLIRIARVDDDPLDDVAEVAHESLLRNWDLLDRLFAEQRVERERRAFLRKQAERWREGKFDRTFLLGGLALQEANIELKATVTSELEREFLAASDAAEAALQRASEEEEERRIAVERARVEVAERQADVERAAAEAARHQAEVQARATERIAGRMAKAKLALWAAMCFMILIAGITVWVSWQARQSLREADERAEQTKLKSDADFKLAREQAAREIAEAQSKASFISAQAAEDKLKADEAVKRSEKTVHLAEAAKALLKDQLVRTETGSMALNAAAKVDEDADLSVLLAAEVVRRDPSMVARMAAVVVNATQFVRANKPLLPTEVGDVAALTLDGAGDHLLTATPDGLAEWSPQSKAAVPSRRLRWDRRPELISSVVYAPDGRTVAAATDLSILIWQPGSEASPRAIAVDRKMDRLAFSADGSMLAAVSTSNEHLRVWSVKDGSVLLARHDEQHRVFSAAFVAGKLVAVQTPESDRSATRLFVYAIANGRIDPVPTPVEMKNCSAELPQYAAAGTGAGLSVRARLCLFDLNRATQGGEPIRDNSALAPTRAAVTDIAFSANGRYVVKLLAQAHEAQVTDLSSGETWRLQGAFDLPESNTYERSLAIDNAGNRLAIKTRDGSVRVFDLRASGRSLVLPRWVSADEKLFVVSVGDGAYELRDLESGRLVRTLNAQGRYRNIVDNDLVLADDGRRLFAKAVCPGGAKPSCVLGFDVASEAEPSELRFNGVVAANYGDLYLVRDGGEWRLHIGTTPEPVFRMPAPSTTSNVEGRAGRAAGIDSIQLGHSRLFAVRTYSADQVTVRLYAVEGSGARLLRTIERPVSTPLDIAFAGAGRVLLLSDRRRTEVWDLKAARETPSFELPGNLPRAAFVNVERGLAAFRLADRSWQVRDLATGATRQLLTASYTVEPTASYAWAPLDGNRGLQVLDLARPQAPPFVVAGPDAQPEFSQRGGLVVVKFPVENRLRIYRMPSLTPLFDADLTSSESARLTRGGGYLTLGDGRLVPVDPLRLVQAARQQLRRDLLDSERCRELDDKAACARDRGAVPAAKVSSAR